MLHSSPDRGDIAIVAIITVTRIVPSGVTAVVNGRPHRFKDLQTLLRVALHVLDGKGTPP